MNRARMNSELLATLRLIGGDKLAVADVLAAFVAWPNRVGRQPGNGLAGAPHNTGDRAAG